jgi:hypothetical protein
MVSFGLWLFVTVIGSASTLFRLDRRRGLC